MRLNNNNYKTFSEFFIKFSHKFKYSSLILTQKILESFWLVAKSTSERGTLEGEEFKFYQNFFSNQKVDLQVIDIGANDGSWHRELLSLGFKHIKIWAVEPIPDFYRLIKLYDNPLVIPVNFAISTSEDFLDIAALGLGATSFPNRHEIYNVLKKEIAWHKIKSIKGDRLVSTEKIIPSLIKIDTDGADFDIIQSFERTLVRFHPILQFEHSFVYARNAHYSLGEVISYLKNLGFRVLVLKSDGTLRKIFFPRLEILNHQTKNLIAIPDSVKYYR